MKPLPQQYVDYLAHNNTVDWGELADYDDFEDVVLLPITDLKVQTLRCPSGIIEEDMNHPCDKQGFFFFDYINLTNFHGPHLLCWYTALGCFGQVEGVNGAHNFALPDVTWGDIVADPFKYLVGSFEWDEGWEFALFPDEAGVRFEPFKEGDKKTLTHVGEPTPYVHPS